MMAQREGKISPQQKEVMVSYMEQHASLAQGKAFRTDKGPTYHELWDTLTLMLNNTIGPKKDKLKWQRVWCDSKNKIRQKLKEIKAFQYNGTHNLQIKLTAIEERIVNMITKKMTENDFEELENITTNHLEFKMHPTRTYLPKQKDHVNIIEAVYLQDIPSTSKMIETIVHNESSLEPRDYEEQYATNNFEENSSSSWNSHDYRSIKHVKNETYLINNAVHDKIDTISLQLEQIIEQNNVTNVLLERIAKSLENKNN